MVSSKSAIDALREAGWEVLQGRGKGSHTVMKDSRTGAVTVIPDRRDIGIGLLKAIERQIGVRLK